MTAALERGEWSAARPGRTIPPGKTRYHFTGGWVGLRADPLPWGGARLSNAFHIVGVGEWLGWYNCLPYKNPRSYLQFSCYGELATESSRVRCEMQLCNQVTCANTETFLACFETCRIPSRSATLKWILDFNVHDSASNRFAGYTRTVRIPENIESFEVCSAAESSALSKATCAFAVHLK